MKANLGRYTRHTPEILLAFAMGTHDRLGASTQQGVGVGKKCPYLDMDAVLVRQIAEMCEWDPHYTISRVRSRLEYLKREYSSGQDVLVHICISQTHRKNKEKRHGLRLSLSLSLSLCEV